MHAHGTDNDDDDEGGGGTGRCVCVWYKQYELNALTDRTILSFDSALAANNAIKSHCVIGARAPIPFGFYFMEM